MTLDLYPSVLLEQDRIPKGGRDIDAICQSIKDATEGFGTNETALLKAMGTQTLEQRCFVHNRYKELFNEDLEEAIKRECGKRTFGTALKYLSIAPDMAECEMLKDACKGVGTNERLIISILCGRTNKEMTHLKKKFFDMYTKDLGATLGSETGGALEYLTFNVLQASEDEYDQAVYNEEKMVEDTKVLYEMGQGSFGTNEKGLFKILISSPLEYLKKLNMFYADTHGITLVKALEQELSGVREGDAKVAALFMIGMKLKPYEEVAKFIHRACEKFGTNELILSSSLIRYQAIMSEVKAAYVKLFGKNIEDVVKSETRGDYESLLLALLGAE